MMILNHKLTTAERDQLTADMLAAFARVCEGKGVEVSSEQLARLVPNLAEVGETMHNWIASGTPVDDIHMAVVDRQTGVPVWSSAWADQG